MYIYICIYIYMYVYISLCTKYTIHHYAISNLNKIKYWQCKYQLYSSYIYVLLDILYIINSCLYVYRVEAIIIYL